MREAQFLKQNAEKWKLYEKEVSAEIPTDIAANRFVELTDDLAYARTFYPKSNTEKYLNGLAAIFHQKIYRNKKEKKGRIFWFWQYELPFLFKQYHKQFLYAFLFFVLFAFMGALSAKYDDNFIRLILGDDYVNMTNLNIEKGDPFGVYKQSDSLSMFLRIAYNNISVHSLVMCWVLLFQLVLYGCFFSNGIMMGAFQYYFISKGMGIKFITVCIYTWYARIMEHHHSRCIWYDLRQQHTFSGHIYKNGLFLKAGKDGLKIVIGLIPLFLTAAFFEGFVTRHTEMPLAVSLIILFGSLVFLIWYFIIYPIKLHRRMEAVNNKVISETENKNFNAWLSKKFNSEK
jgi:uncharacterized membrane protein SpoIIM required for sporulation